MTEILSWLFYGAVLFVSVILSAQAIFSLYLMLYTWARPDRLAAAATPKPYLPPELSFTAILPARHEEDVIAATLKGVWEANYPKDKLEVVVVCEEGDTGTIAEAQRAADEIGHPNVRVVTFNDGPINKPHGLNVAFANTKNDVVTIFDAEDDVHRDIFNVANTIMSREGASVLQAGVQLMDYRSSWYAIHNVLEYFFWFKSRLHFHAKAGMIPLGGNTVFMRRYLVAQAGGWDENCLTEDADIGIRLSVSGERIATTYDAEHATQEETPPSVGSFIKQRTRWNQGFLQVLRKRDWKQLPSRTQRALAFYTLTYPFIQAALGLLIPLAILMILFAEVPLLIAMISFLPLYALAFQYLVTLVGLFEFTKVYKNRVRIRDLAKFTVGFLPYQALLGLGALRAVWRDVKGMTAWEKTSHSGAHRKTAVPAKAPVATPAAASAPSENPARKQAPAPDGTEAWSAGRTARPAGVLPISDFDRLLEEATERFGAERGSVLVQEPDKSAFTVKASRGLPENVVRSANLGVDKGVAGWVVGRMSPAVIRGNRAPEGLQARLNQPDLCSSVVVPVEKDGSLAVVSLSSTHSELDHQTLDWLSERVEDLITKA